MHKLNYSICLNLVRARSEKMEKLKSRIEMVGRKMLGVILKKGSIEFVGSGHEVGTLCCVYKHQRDDHSISSSLKYDVIRMLIRGTDYSHSLCFHVCNGSSQFHVYSKKSWLSFFPQPGALIVTAGDQTQVSLINSYFCLHYFLA